MQDFETVADALIVGRAILKRVGIETAALDVRLLLYAVTGLEPAEFIVSPDYPLSPMERNQFIDFMVRRAKGEPVSRIMNMREFYGREFSLSRFVLDPRPDTETVIDLVLARHGVDTLQQMVDLGAGSGAIIVTLLAERPTWTGLAIDLSPRAIEMTLVNAETHLVVSRMKSATGSWLEGRNEKFDLIVSNPPYIPHRDIAGLSKEVRQHDPALALDGGKDGLACYRSIASQARKHLTSAGEVIVEIGAGQQDGVAAIFGGHGFTLADQRSDLGGHVRVLAFSHV